MSSVLLPYQCQNCEHIWVRVEGPDIRRGACEAFPDGIPDAILSNEHDHRRVYRGDGGIRFEPMKE